MPITSNTTMLTAWLKKGRATSEQDSETDGEAASMEEDASVPDQRGKKRRHAAGITERSTEKESGVDDSGVAVTVTVAGSGAGGAQDPSTLVHDAMADTPVQGAQSSRTSDGTRSALSEISSARQGKRPRKATKDPSRLMTQNTAKPTIASTVVATRDAVAAAPRQPITPTAATADEEHGSTSVEPPLVATAPAVEPAAEDDVRDFDDDGQADAAAAAPVPQVCVTLSHCQCAVASHNSGAGQRELSSLHIARRAGPPSLSTATVTPGAIVLVRCTSTEHKAEFRLEKNIMKVFARFRSEGKATIRLKTPQLDIVVSKADPRELEQFLTTLYTVHTDPTSLPPLPGTAMLLLQPVTKEKLAFESQKKLSVGPDRDLPASYPPALEWLKLNGHGLRAIPRKVLALHRLTSLDLSNNSLADVDRVLAKLPSLVSVNLSHNELREMPAALLIPTMRRINLSHNSIVELPRRIYKLTGLETLVLCHNKLETISPYISHLKALRELKVSNNRLKSLPAEIRKFRRVRLQNLDLSGNPFGVCSLPEYTALALRFTVPSLRELAARTVLNSKTVVDRAELPWMINRYTKQFDVSTVTESMVHLVNGNAVPICHRVCSQLCLASGDNPRTRDVAQAAAATAPRTLSAPSGRGVTAVRPVSTKWGPMRRHAASKVRAKGAV